MNITPAVVRTLLDYNPYTGKLFWKKRDSEMFPSEGSMKSWNARYAGTEAGSIFSSKKDSYKAINVSISLGGKKNEKIIRAHRLCWMHYYNEEIEAVVDHINRNALDNRIKNLRLSSISLNAWNKSIGSRNTSGIVNVYWDKKRNAWQALVRAADRKGNKFLGYFDDKLEAARVVAQFRKENGYPMHNHFSYLDGRLHNDKD